LSINDYIARLEAVINSSVFVASYNLNIDRKTSDIAFINGKIDFRDGTSLDFKEFIEGAEDIVEIYKYAYNYRIGSTVIFRYDNAPDPGARTIVTFPHHKHVKDGDIIASQQVILSDVLTEIEVFYLEDTNR